MLHRQEGQQADGLDQPDVWLCPQLQQDRQRLWLSDLQKPTSLQGHQLDRCIL